MRHDLGSSGTSLISALRHHHEPLLEFLLNKRTDVDPSYGRWGHMLPPIGVAVRMNRDIKWTERLLWAGARVEVSGALHVAAIRGDIPRMRLLLQYGANFNEVPMWRVLAFVKYNKKGTPVHWAIVGGSTEAVRLLFSQISLLLMRMVLVSGIDCVRLTTASENTSTRVYYALCTRDPKQKMGRGRS